MASKIKTLVICGPSDSKDSASPAWIIFTVSVSEWNDLGFNLKTISDKAGELKCPCGKTNKQIYEYYMNCRILIVRYTHSVKAVLDICKDGAALNAMRACSKRNGACKCVPLGEPGLEAL